MSMPKQFAAGLMLCAISLGSMLLGGCKSDKPSQAAKAYPAEIQPQNDMHLAAKVDAETSEITLENFSDAELQDFDLWINKSYLLHIDDLPANESKSFEAEDFHDANDSTLDQNPPEVIRKVQIATKENKIYNVQGPHMQ